VSANREALIRVAHTLRPLLDELVFVGGRVVELYLTDPISARPRPTRDTDAVCEVCTHSEFQNFEQQLRAIGLRHDTSKGAHMCRWRSDTDTIDILPADPSRFGFDSRWYEYGVATARDYQLAGDLTIRIFAPTVFLADKLDAFEGRGAESDPRASHDLEDILSVIAGRPEIVSEFENEIRELRMWVAQRFENVFSGDIGEEVMESLLPRTSDRPGLLPTVSARVLEIAEST
jgi:hypothetical protein